MMASLVFTGWAEQVRERIRRQTSNAGLALRLVPEVPNEGLLLSRAALLRDSLGQRFAIQAQPASLSEHASARNSHMLPSAALVYVHISPPSRAS